MSIPYTNTKYATIMRSQGPKTFTIEYDCYHQPGIHTAEVEAANEKHAIDIVRRSNTHRNIISIASIHEPATHAPEPKKRSVRYMELLEKSKRYILVT